MSNQLKYSILHLSLWLIVAILFLSIFFSSDTIENWGDSLSKTIMLAALFLLGFGGDAVLRVIFRKRKNKVNKDERDTQIQLKSIAGSFIIVAIYIFVVAISLYVYFEDLGVLPVAWLWFIAYSLVVVANISTSAFSIYYYWKDAR